MKAVQWSGPFNALLGALYPARCGLCGQLGDLAICAGCQNEMTPLSLETFPNPAPTELDYVASAYRYERRAAQAVRRLKFSRTTSLAMPMSHILRRAASRLEGPEPDATVPVPIHYRRRAMRGFNQAELLCDAFSRSVYRSDLLRRVRYTRPQVGLTRIERLENLQGAFRASSAAAGLHVLLLDDVFTSGGTAVECAKALKAAGAIKVGILTFAGQGASDEPWELPESL